MKNFLLLLLISVCTNVYAISPDFIKTMGYESTYDKALQKAKKENKNIMMVVVQKSCPWCRKMEKQTLKKKQIDSLIKKRFIPLLVDEASKGYPKKFEAKLFPTTIFIDIKNEKQISKVLGYKNKKEFKKILEEVNKK
jgi:thioredoxin-related protein